MQEPDYFTINREIAYKGRIGQQRRDFCISYTRRKKKRIEEIQSAQLEAAKARGEMIACQKGCCFCCSMYVEATIQECEAIVYYLYQDESVLKGFLHRYPQWRDSIRENGDLFKSCGRFWNEEMAADNAQEMMQVAD